MREKKTKSEIERRIDSGLFACSFILVVVVLGGVAQVFCERSITGHWAYYPVLLSGAWILADILKRTRPLFENAGKGWGRVYRFVLNQMDIESAFKHKKKDAQP